MEREIPLSRVSDTSIVSDLLGDFLASDKSMSTNSSHDNLGSSMHSSSSLTHFGGIQHFEKGNDEEEQSPFQDTFEDNDFLHIEKNDEEQSPFHETIHHETFEEGINIASEGTSTTSIFNNSSLYINGVHRRNRFAGSVTKFGNVVFNDHPSLSNPSSHVTFREEEAVVFVQNFEQISLEKKKNEHFFTVKQTSLASPGILMLRAAYTLISFLMAGFLFIFSLNIVLFLFMGLVIESGKISNRETVSVFQFVGTLLSIPVFTSGLSQVMVIAQVFVVDTWRGGKFLKTTFTWDNTAFDWINFFIFCGFPVLVASLSLCTRVKDWWEITSLCWFSLVFLYYICFAATVVFCEIRGCFYLIRHHPKLRDLNKQDDHETCMNTFRRAIKLTLRQRYSGYETIRYLARESESVTSKLNYNEIKERDSIKSFINPYSRLTRLSCMRMLYKRYDEPVRAFNVNEVLEFTNYVTNSSWGLEMIYCRDRRANYIAIIEGRAAVSLQQANSSLACYVIGTIMTWLAAVSVLVWFEVGTVSIVVFSIAYLISLYRSARDIGGMNAIYQSVVKHNQEDGLAMATSKESNALYQVQETFRITEPTPSLIWTYFCLEFVALLILPMIALLIARNFRVGILFICLSILFTIRTTVNAPASFRELGSLDGIEVSNQLQTPRAEWREKHRLGKILSEISVGKKSNYWRLLFLFFTTLFGAIVVAATMDATNSENQTSTTFDMASPDFQYSKSKDLNYAMCSLFGDDSNHGQLADLTFLSLLSSFDKDESSIALTKWFSGEAVQLNDAVVKFQTDYRKTRASSVSYTLFEFPNEKTKIISIRGTTTARDTLADIQLWMAAVFAQLFRALIPLGGFFTPVLPYLVKAVSIVEEKALENVSYHNEIVAFAKTLIEEADDDTTVKIVGHSLGGGIAMIAAAQLHVPGIGLSAPNTIISRMTFDPMIPLEALQKFTFNIIPDRDVVPRVDDRTDNYQRIKCRTKPHEFVGCHSATRSLCEILYTCGSSNRPIPCNCVNEFGFDVPKSERGLNFTDDCPSEKSGVE